MALALHPNVHASRVSEVKLHYTYVVAFLSSSAGWTRGLGRLGSGGCCDFFAPHPPDAGSGDARGTRGPSLQQALLCSGQGPEVGGHPQHLSERSRRLHEKFSRAPSRS